MSARTVTEQAHPQSVVADSRFPRMRAREGATVVAATLLVALAVLFLIGGGAEAVQTAASGR